MEQSVLETDKLLASILLDDLKNDPDNLKLEFSKLMAYMLTHYVGSKPQLEIKIAVPSIGSGIYHQKIGIMKYENDERIAFSGSVNETGLGWNENVENFTVFRSWGDDTNNQGVMDSQREFNDLWNNSREGVRVFDLPDAVQKHMLEIRPESDEELRDTISRIKSIISSKKTISTQPKPEPQLIRLRDYQKDAIEKWKESGFRGLLEMATGTGKTFTAFGCMAEIQNQHDRFVIIISSPQRHLVAQWKENLEKWNEYVDEQMKIAMDEDIVCNSDNPQWRAQFQQILYDFNSPPLGFDTYLTNKLVIFTTHNTLSLPDFTNTVLGIENAPKFLIVDEVHNITEQAAQKTLLDEFDFRLGLSATPFRHLDEQGTRSLQEYFGGIVYTLDLKAAIYDLGVLCKYKYFPYYVELTTNEMKVYQRLTGQIAQIEEKKKKGTYHKMPGEYDPYLARASLVANAENKYKTFDDILRLQFNNKLSDTLIYCTNTPSPAAPDSKQLERVQQILVEHKLVSDSITWVDKTMDRLSILNRLSGGHFDCVTAVGCLDEGVDIPSVSVGIFMASSGNPKQFIQRRGRILRRSDDTGKTKASIYDILVMPPYNEPFTLSQRKLIAKELIRHKDFSTLAINAEEAMEQIRPVAEAFDIDLDRLSYEYVRNMV